jgi:hypothetical protein
MRMLIKGQADIQIFISDTRDIFLNQRHEEEGDQVIEFTPASKRFLGAKKLGPKDRGAQRIGLKIGGGYE